MNELSKRIQENLFKILVIGDPGVGKTSIIKQATLGCFSANYRPTVGLDFIVKRFQCDADNLVRMQLWDVAGQERYGDMTRVYYKDAVGAFVVFDLTRPETFGTSRSWKEDLDRKVMLPDGKNIPCVLLANKCDEEGERAFVLSKDEIDVYCGENGYVGWYETSAKSNVGIDDALRRLSEEILSKKHLYPYVPPAKFTGENEEKFLLSEKVDDPDYVGDRLKKKCYCE